MVGELPNGGWEQYLPGYANFLSTRFDLTAYNKMANPGHPYLTHLRLLPSEFGPNRGCWEQKWPPDAGIWQVLTAQDLHYLYESQVGLPKAVTLRACEESLIRD